MKAPENLKHKPIIAVQDYDQKDGIYAPVSDAKALSIGQAQYDESEISVKVFRYVGQKWSRQSEELPIHRTLDLTILIIGTMLGGSGTLSPITSLDETVVSEGRVQEISEYYERNKHILEPRLLEIKQLLDNLL